MSVAPPLRHPHPPAAPSTGLQDLGSTLLTCVCPCLRETHSTRL